MADNVPITAGSGTNIATDDVGGTHYQIIKNAFGALDTATLVTATVGMPVEDAPSGTATLANVAASATSVTIDAANTSRKGLLLVNDSTASCFVKYGATASATSYTVFMGPGAYWEMPKPIYTGTIDGIWTAAAGNMRVTELT